MSLKEKILEALTDDEIESGKMHKMLEIDPNINISDYYKKNVNLFLDDLLTATSYDDAMKMVNFAANIKSSKDFFDKARNILKNRKDEEINSITN